jgi:hypothetical protein
MIGQELDRQPQKQLENPIYAFYLSKQRYGNTREGYLPHSGNPNRLWFRFRFWVKNPIQGNRLDRHRLLCEAEEELACPRSGRYLFS